MHDMKVLATPFFDVWLSSIKDIAIKGRILTALAKLANGNFSDHKSVGDGVSELRLHFGKGYRIYYGRKGATLVVLLCGGNKSFQQKDIERAKEYWQSVKEKYHEIN